MTEKAFEKWVQASDKAAKEQVQHLVVLLTPDGNLQINGAKNFVNSLNKQTIFPGRIFLEQQGQN